MKVIYIGGADHSGSTLVGAILGSSPNGALEHFHVGEIHAFFKPNMRTFGKPDARALGPYGAIWDQVDPNVGYSAAYGEIRRVVPGITTLIDSSKTANNLSSQLAGKNVLTYPFQIVLTYRPFEKIVQSDRKRGKTAQKIRENLMTYPKLFSMIDKNNISYSVIDIEAIIDKPSATTEVMCSTVGIPYFQQKERYWDFAHAHLFGAKTQREHILNPKDAGYNAKGLSLGKEDIVPLFDDAEINVAENRLKKEKVP